MTKKYKIWLSIAISLIVVFATALTLFFVLSNKNDEKIKLNTPTVSLQFYDTEKYLVCSFDPNATDYAFYIYSDGDYPNRKYDYIKYLASENESQAGTRISSYIDVTNIFSEPKDYYYFCKVIGDKDFEDSDETEIFTYSNKYKLSTPKALSISGTTLSWRGVSNAVSYDIYEGANFSKIDSTETTTFDVANFINSSSQTSFQFYVVAVGEGNYENSDRSDSESYTKSYTLQQVTGLKFSNDTLSWNAVDNASSYEIVLNGERVFTSQSNSCSFKNEIASTGDFTFKVRAIGQGIYKTGQDSEVYRVTKTQKLAKVSNISYSTTEDSIIITWDYPDEAITFTIKIDGETLHSSFSGCNLVLPKGSKSSVKVEIVVNGYDYYLSSDPVQKTFNF